MAPPRLAAAILGSFVLCAPSTSPALSLQVTVVNSKGEGVQDAVVYALPKAGTKEMPAESEPIPIDQVDKEFVPHVTAVRAGTSVAFPNRDQIRHHVYSFSPAKTFEIPLYKGEPAEPVVFDKVGVVALGCNIHDWMTAYIVVTDSPHSAVTRAKGKATLAGLPAGEYEVRVWHATMKGDPESTNQTVSLGDGTHEIRFEIQQKRVWKPRRGGRRSRDRYR